MVVDRTLAIPWPGQRVTERANRLIFFLFMVLMAGHCVDQPGLVPANFLNNFMLKAQCW